MPAATYNSDLQQNKYSPLTGLVYVFNLIVGTGALTLPGAFSRAGWGLGMCFILVLSFISFMTVTFIIETMSIANAVLLRRRKVKESEDSSSPTESRVFQSSTSRRERDPLIPVQAGEVSENFRGQRSTFEVYEINQRVELGRMASMFFGKVGLYLFYLCIVVYLYGDLAIYITAVAKSLRDVSCTYNPASGNSTVNNTHPLPDTAYCWSDDDGMTRFGAYRLYSIIFLVTLGPFCFFNVSKTKYLQLLTSVMRWTAFLIMIGLASKRIINGDSTGRPSAARLSALPNLFGVCVYSFMCHHSLPSLVTPISTKKKIYSLLSADYILISVFYLLLALTGIFAFDRIDDLYTLNFEPNHSGETPPVFTLIVQYFLSLFPVFTLSTSFPIIAITLRNNLKALFQVVDEEDEELSDESEDSDDESGLLGYPTTSPALITRRRRRLEPPPPTTIFCKLLSKAGFPLLAILPPFLIAVLMADVQLLVSVTGSYAGSFIQYIIPIFLVFHARKRVPPSLTNPYASPFKHVAWLFFVFIWAVISISFVTIHRFINPEAAPPS